MNNPKVEDVKAFWESHPLFSGESKYPVGSLEFFEEHRKVAMEDCFAGSYSPLMLPEIGKRSKVLDLGCGIGFWTVELLQQGVESLTAADLTEQALSVAQKRCEAYGVEASFSLENAEKMSFADGTFSHVNCMGVIHHTPDTEACVREIARVLRSGGTAGLSVYHKNIYLKSWPFIRSLGKLLHRKGAKLKGRGREDIFAGESADEIVRLFDGADNPIGKSYSRREFKQMLEPYFDVEAMGLHYFPARALPFRIPKFLHRFLNNHTGFLIYAKCRKK